MDEINNIDDKIIKELTIKNLSEDTNISINTIKGMIKGKEIKIVNTEKKDSLNKYEKAERRLIYYMLRHSEVIKIYDKNKCYFPTREFRFLANEILYYFNKYKVLNIADFISYLNDKEELLNAMNEVDLISVDDNYTHEEIMDYINLLNDYNVKMRIKNLTEEFKSSVDDKRKTEIAKEISELKVSE